MFMSDPTAEWLIELVLGAAAQSAPQAGIITSPRGFEYKLLGKVGSTERYNLYSCLSPSGRMCVFKIAATSDFNQQLEHETTVLRLMKAKEEEIEAQRSPHERPYGFHNFFPEVIESFISKSQGERRISILGFPTSIETTAQLTPISNLLEVEKVRLDPKSIAWIFGKSLKTLGFSNDCGISNNWVSGSNILIERTHHGVFFFDWTLATIYPDGVVPRSVSASQIAQASSWALALLKGSLEEGEVPRSDQLQDNRFVDFLMQAANGKMTDGTKACNQFYKLIYELWPRGYHPFTSYNV